MKKLLSILLLFVSFEAIAQTYDTLPAGSKPYGSFYLGPDGNLVFGNVGLKYRVLGTKKRVDSLLALKAPISGSANYIQNNNTGTPQSASFNINGIGRFDSPTATTLFGAGIGSFSNEAGVTTINGGNVNVGVELLTPDVTTSDSSGKAANTKFVKQLLPTFSNGLVKTANNVALGGQLSSDVSIDNNNNSFSVANYSGQGGSFSLNSGAVMSTTIGSNAGFTSFFSSDLNPTTDVTSTLGVIDGVGRITAFSIATDGLTQFSDDINSHGIDYKVKYRTNIGNRWLTDKEYVDSVASGRLAVLPNGNVLIGSTVDDGVNKLQVDGNIKTNGIILKTGSGIGLNLTNQNDSDLQFEISSVGATNKFAAISSSTSTPLVLQQFGANVGINTLTPTEQLDVNGNIKSSSLSGTGDRPLVADANGVLKIGSGGGNTSNPSNFTAGRVPYTTGANTLADNANFAWDNTNRRLTFGGLSHTQRYVSSGVSKTFDWGFTSSGSSTYTWKNTTDNQNAMLLEMPMGVFGGGPGTLTSRLGIGNMSSIPTEAQLYVYGGRNGANIDMRGDSNNSDEANMDFEGADWETAGPNSIGISYYGSQYSAGGTSYGYAKNKLGQIRFGEANTALITSDYNGNGTGGDPAKVVPIRFGINQVEVANFNNSGLQINSLAGTGDRSVVSDATGKLKNASAVPNSTAWNGQTLGVTGLATGDFIKYNGSNWTNSKISQFDFANPSGTLTRLAGFNGSNEAMHWSDTQVRTFLSVETSSSGTYTPTATINSNATTVTSSLAHYKKIGNEVTVTGKVSTASISGSSDVSIYISLPPSLTSNLTTADDLIGSGSVNLSANPAKVIVDADTAGDRALLTIGLTPTGTGYDAYYSFTYTIK